MIVISGKNLLEFECRLFTTNGRQGRLSKSVDLRETSTHHCENVL
ncbi:hypothetical protein D777_02663 [Marinobacter nitratireducens]|uniref:Uncharacterized protein n=1 Tax=Marinobacter nitratireducens TaxID=1137280 RepID=A0A072MZQ5_9GAMM|nr:hypothetical protein D777_02663 [Marinobacter nitratireducens]